jgi:hypothetical protein
VIPFLVTIHIIIRTGATVEDVLFAHSEMLRAFLFPSIVLISQSIDSFLLNEIQCNMSDINKSHESEDRKWSIRIDHQFRPFLYRHPHSDSQGQ